LKLLGRSSSGKSSWNRCIRGRARIITAKEIGESAEEKARRIIAEEMARWGWAEAELGRRRKGDAGKVKIAQRLRRETTASDGSPINRRWGR
jgi:hypothetical protein